MRMLTASMRSGPIPGKAFLTRVLWRVHAAAQEVRSQEEFELASIVLQLIGQRLEHLSGITVGDLGVLTASMMLDLATIAAHGMKFREWGRRNELRKSAQAWELSRINDPNVDEARGIRRPETGTGNLYAMPSTAKPEKQKPLRILPGETAANQ